MTIYKLIELRANEWAVCARNQTVPCGTIRRLTHNTYGWHDITGYHEYPTQEMAAIECLNSARSRRIRQMSRAEQGKYVRQKVSA